MTATPKPLSTDQQIRALLLKRQTASRAGDTLTRVEHSIKNTSVRIRFGSRRASFVAYLQKNKKRKLVTLGNFADNFGIKEAKRAYDREVEDRHANRASVDASLTFGGVILDYLALTVEDMSDTSAEGRNAAREKSIASSPYLNNAKTQTPLRAPAKIVDSLIRDVYPRLCDIPANSLRRRDVTDMVKDVHQSHGYEPARLCLLYCHRVGVWAEATGLVEEYTAGGLTLSSLSLARVKTGKGERLPQRDEIADLFTLLMHTPRASEEVKAATRILCHLACRSGELTKARWSEVNFRTRSWNVPAEHMKGGRKMTYPLSPALLELFKGLRDVTGESGLVLGGLSDKALARAFKRWQTPGKRTPAAWQTGDTTITPHHLRNLFSTQARQLKLGSNPLIESCLAHEIKASEVQDKYDFSNNIAERREVMDKWSWIMESPRKRLEWPDGIVADYPDPDREVHPDLAPVVAVPDNVVSLKG